MGETHAARRLKIKRYQVLIGKLGAKNRARRRLQALIDEMEVQLRSRPLKRLGWEQAVASRVDAGARLSSPPTWRTPDHLHRVLGPFPLDAGEPTELILSDSQIFGGRLATVAHFFVAHLGTLIEAA